MPASVACTIIDLIVSDLGNFYSGGGVGREGKREEKEKEGAEGKFKGFIHKLIIA